jgi:hypothetical protein
MSFSLQLEKDENGVRLLGLRCSFAMLKTIAVSGSTVIAALAPLLRETFTASSP